MYMIKKVRIDCTVDFAAEELKKYLRMMMPKNGDIPISYDPEAKEGFRLGLFGDFGIPFEGKDAALDDIVHIETDENGGILAGSNPRSVLFAVYRFLKENGCRFLFPGTDGEIIPMKPVAPVRYHHMASYRYRGHTTEGSPSLEQVLLYIDYHAKQEMNVYGAYEAFSYFRRYYLHAYNKDNRKAETITREMVDQWDGLIQAELGKRGMQIWSGGHGWIARLVGIDLEDRYLYKSGEKPCPEEVKPNLAMIKGKRDLNRRDPVFTNFCMSRADLRTKYCKMMVQYIEENPQLDQISVSLADTSHNHCECSECVKKRPSDWLIMMLNELDGMLTEKGLTTRIQCSAYVDCMFPPVEERLNNPDRFVLKATPIARRYNSSLREDTVYPPMEEYVRNAWENPRSTEAYFSLFKGWQQVFPGDCMIYEYHFWKPQYRDLGSMAMSRRMYEDVYSWKFINACGAIQDGSNKSFWPNGFVDYIYNATLLNRDLDYEAELAEYYSCCYGKDWQLVRQYLEQISETFDHHFFCGDKSADMSQGEFYNPAHVANLEKIPALAEGMRQIIAAQEQPTSRPQVICWRLLQLHTEYVEGFAEVMKAVCQGQREEAAALFEAFKKDFGKCDHEIERYMDIETAFMSLSYVVKNIPKVEF